VLDEVFDLFVSLEANDEQLDFPVLFASGRNGYASDDPEARDGTLAPLFEKIVEHVPAPSADPDGPFKFLVTLLDRDNFLGRILTGLVFSGSVRTNMPIHALDNDGKVVETGRASKIMAFRGLERVPVEEANAGDIISIAGLTPRPSPTPSPIPASPSRCTRSRSIRRLCRCASPSTTRRWRGARAPR
jgi:GTP-binding protein